MSDIEYSVITSDVIKSFDCITRKHLNHTIALWGRATEKITVIRHQEDNQSKVTSHLCIDCKTRKDIKYCITKQEPKTESPQIMGATINNESTTTIEPPP